MAIKTVVFVGSDGNYQIDVESLEHFDCVMKTLNEKRVDIAKYFAGKPIENYTGSALYKNGILYKVKEGYEKSLLEQKGANILLKDGMYKEMIGMAPWNCGFDLDKPLTVYDDGSPDQDSDELHAAAMDEN
jgi:hypothetical protein